MNRDARLNAKQLAAELGCGEYVVYAVKKANRMLVEQGAEKPIFSGRLSTPGKVSKWLDDHPDFVARRVLRKMPGQSGTPSNPAATTADTLCG
jgi:hypothetical protein